jgi:alpha-1,2-mannosyltransferase
VRAWLRRTGSTRAAVLALAAAAAVLGAVVAANHDGFKDLLVYQHAGQAVLDRAPVYGSEDPVSGLRFTYPPFAAVAMTPLALAPTWLAAAIWTAVSVVALVATVVVVRRALGRPTPAPLVVALPLAAFALEPVWQNATFGQINSVLMLAVLLDLLGPQTRRSGILVGLAAGVKLTPLVFVVLLVLVGRRTAAGRATLTFVVTVLLGLAVMPGAATTYWTDRLLDASRIGPPALAHNQSVEGVLTRLLDGPPPTMAWLAVAAPIAALVLLVAAGCWRTGDPVLGTGVAALAMLLASPVSWSHHWVWAFPIALALWEHGRWIATTWSTVFVARPILWPPWGEHREYGWSPVDHVVGNAYVLAALALVVWAAVVVTREHSGGGGTVKSCVVTAWRSSSTPVARSAPTRSSLAGTVGASRSRRAAASSRSPR